MPERIRGPRSDELCEWGGTREHDWRSGEVETQWSSGCLQSREPSSVLKTGASGQLRWKKWGCHESEKTKTHGDQDLEVASMKARLLIYHKFSAYQA